jgi:hypothetical protein
MALESIDISLENIEKGGIPMMARSPRNQSADVYGILPLLSD